MKEILVYYGKHGEVYWDATDRHKAYLALFKHLDKDWNFYHILKDLDALEKEVEKCKDTLEELKRTLPDKSHVLFPGHQKAIEDMERKIQHYNSFVGMAKLYAQAKKGNASAANQLLGWRNNYEYERWSIEQVQEV
jgi:hypothetical protein